MARHKNKPIESSDSDSSSSLFSKDRDEKFSLGESDLDDDDDDDDDAFEMPRSKKRRGGRPSDPIVLDDDSSSSTSSSSSSSSCSPPPSDIDVSSSENSDNSLDGFISDSHKHKKRKTKSKSKSKSKSSPPSSIDPSYFGGEQSKPISEHCVKYLIGQLRGHTSSLLSERLASLKSGSGGDSHDKILALNSQKHVDEILKLFRKEIKQVRLSKKVFKVKNGKDGYFYMEENNSKREAAIAVLNKSIKKKKAELAVQRSKVDDLNSDKQLLLKNIQNVKLSKELRGDCSGGAGRMKSLAEGFNERKVELVASLKMSKSKRKKKENNDRGEGGQKTKLIADVTDFSMADFVLQAAAVIKEDF